MKLKALPKFLIIISACFFIGFSLPSCSHNEPIIPSDVAEKIKENLGYALAPAWLPEEFEYSGPFINNSYPEQAFANREMVQSYSKIISTQESAQLVMSYPMTDTTPSSISEFFGDLVPPEDAESEVEVNGKTAYLLLGTWSEETRQRIEGLEIPLNPEWDYEGGISIRFTIDIPNEDNIRVRIFTVFPTDEISANDLIRIAGSVVVLSD